MIDTIVVGGGPGGLVAARRLASHGFHAVVCEEHDEVGAPVHCTGVLAHEALINLSLPGEALLNPLTSVRFIAPAGRYFEYATPSTEAVVIDRGIFDRALAQSARAAGAELRPGCRVTAIDVHADRVDVSIDAGPTLQARSVVLAAGVNYTFQRRLGLGMPAAFLQSAQLELRAARRLQVEVYFGSSVAPKGFAWAVPVERADASFARIGVMADGNATAFFKAFVARLQHSWQLEVDPAQIPRRRMLPLGALRRTYSDRVVAVGDAAGLVKPTTGGGIFYSVVSGELAADVLASQLHAGDLSAGALREYERRWRAQFQSEFTAQVALRVLAERMSDGEIDELFDLARTDGILPLVRQTARFNRHRNFILALFRHSEARRILRQRLVGG